MTPAEFKKKWSKFTGKESSGYQSHFDDLCRLLKVPTPSEADPDAEFFCFQKRVVKDAELFAVAESGEEAAPDERGFADVWKRGCFAWEYKGKRKNLDEAYKQLLRYREALENPPVLVVCDFDRYVVKTNFNGTVQEVFEFTNATIDHPNNWRVLRALLRVRFHISDDFPLLSCQDVVTLLAFILPQTGRDRRRGFRQLEVRHKKDAGIVGFNTSHRHACKH